MTKEPKKVFLARIVLALLAVAFILIGGLAHRNAQVAMDAHRWGTHAKEALLEIEGLQAAANSVEAVLQNGADGLTKAEAEELDSARASEFEYLARLSALTSDNAAQQQRILQLRKILVERPEERPTGSVPANIVELRERQAGAQQREVTRILQAMMTEGRRVLVTRESRALNAAHAADKAVIALLFICGTFLFGAMFILQRDRKHRIAAEKRADEAAQRREQWVRELEEQNRKIGLLNKFSATLQLCDTQEEVFSIVPQLLIKACPHQGGALGRITESRSLVEIVKYWGDVHSEEIFATADCCGLRRGLPHTSELDKPNLICRHILPDGHSYVCIPLVAQGEALGILHLQVMAEQSDELRMAMQEVLPPISSAIAMTLANLRLRDILHNQSIRDSLTGLYNRRYLEEILDRELHRSNQQQFSVLMLDIDHFKNFNDRYGHEAGDAVLCAVAETLQQVFRKDDAVCRFGGEEFAVILNDVHGERAVQFAGKIAERLRQISIQVAGQVLPPITVSGGLAEFPIDGMTLNELLRAADARLYKAKHTGRNRIVLPEDNSALIGYDSSSA